MPYFLCLTKKFGYIQIIYSVKYLINLPYISFKKSQRKTSLMAPIYLYTHKEDIILVTHILYCRFISFF